MLTADQLRKFLERGYTTKFPNLFLKVGQRWENAGKLYTIVDISPSEDYEVGVALKSDSGGTDFVDGCQMVVTDEWRLHDDAQDSNPAPSRSSG